MQDKKVATWSRSHGPQVRFKGLASHFQSLSGYSEIAPESHMFTEDVRNGIMPYRSMGGAKDFSVSIGEDAGAVELLQSLTRHGRSYTNKDLLCDVVNELAANMSWYGRAIYQIHYSDENHSREIGLRWCTPKRLYVVPGFYVHHVPKADREEFGARFITVPKRDVWEIGMPFELGGVRGYRRMLKGLERYKGATPLFVQEDLHGGRNTPYFKLAEYVRNKEIQEARLTLLWGWDRRDSSLDQDTEFYHFYRTIIFHWAQAILRDHIISELNSLLKRLQFNSQIVVQGLLTPEAILRTLSQMSSGELSFSEAYKSTSIY